MYVGSWNDYAKLTTAQLCAVSFDSRLDSDLDMATLFFAEVFGTDAAPRVMSGLIALSILGNIVVMTFTASRGTILSLDMLYVRQHSNGTDTERIQKSSKR